VRFERAKQHMLVFSVGLAGLIIV